MSKATADDQPNKLVQQQGSQELTSNVKNYLTTLDKGQIAGLVKQSAIALKSFSVDNRNTVALTGLVSGLAFWRGMVAQKMAMDNLVNLEHLGDSTKYVTDMKALKRTAIMVATALAIYYVGSAILAHQEKKQQRLLSSGGHDPLCHFKSTISVKAEDSSQ